VLLAIVAVALAQAKTSIDGLTASTSAMNLPTMFGVDANGAVIENEGAFTTALRWHCCGR
jgi:hypothetical protein